MYCSLGQNQLVDDAGAPLSAGRVKIYAKGSDTLLPIYEDNGDGFVPAQNPVITANDGRIPTVFWPAALVDVVVEKSNGDGTYTELDSYVAGLDLSSIDAVQGVGSITELRSIAPSENMVVQVNGYYTAGDSPTRKYLWVAGAANTDDGGYVIQSNRDYNGGRWVMLWNDTEFLPVSLYGIMCGYSGYAKTSNIPALEGLGHYVLVGSVRVEVPPVILFDGRMAQPTSGHSSPISYYWSGTMTTTHYVACAINVTFSISTPPTIHCAGVRGESYATAYWMVDQDYTSKDPAEKISTLMFSGNTQAMHDAFMACVACSKVAFVDLYGGGVYTTITNLDDFSKKVVTDYNGTGTPPLYDYSLVIYPTTGHIYNSTVAAYNVFAGANVTAGFNVTAEENVSGKNVNATENVTAGSRLIFREGLRFYGKTVDCITNPNDEVNFYPNSPEFPHGLYVVGALNATTLSDSQRKMHVKVPTSGAMTVALTEDSQTLSATSFYNSRYKENDIVVVSNTGSGTLSVVAVENASTVVLNQYESCAFIKVGSSRWNRISPT